MFGYEEKTANRIYISISYTLIPDLLLLLNSKYSPYILIKAFDRVITNKTNHHDVFIHIASLVQKY